VARPASITTCLSSGICCLSNTLSTILIN
jgi:hypothetical protein